MSAIQQEQERYTVTINLVVDGEDIAVELDGWANNAWHVREAINEAGRAVKLTAEQTQEAIQRAKAGEDLTGR